MHTFPYRHPLATHAAGTVLGYRRSGSPIYAIAGGDGTGEPTEPTGTEPEPTGSGEPNAGTNAAEAARLRKEVEKLRKENASARTNAKETAAQEARASLVAEFAKVLGLADQELTPEQLRSQLEAAQQGQQSALGDAISAQIELTVYRTAAAAGADADALLDSRRFVDAVDGLDVDPTDRKAFEAAVRQLVTDHLDKNPTLRTAPAAPAGRSGATAPPAGAPQARKRAGSLHDAVAARFANGG